MVGGKQSYKYPEVAVADKGMIWNRLECSEGLDHSLMVTAPRSYLECMNELGGYGYLASRVRSGT